MCIRDRVVAVHNAVRFASQELEAEERGVDDKIVTFLGRITYQKGPDYFVEAAAKVLKRLKNVRFVMAGSCLLYTSCITKGSMRAPGRALLLFVQNGSPGH